MNEKELRQAYEQIIGNMQTAIGVLHQVVGQNPPPLVGIHAYEALRRSEDFVARVGHIMAILSSRTDAAVDQAVEAAIANGTVVPPQTPV